MVEHADAVVIGMGPGGEDVAGRLAEAGLDVIGIEKQLVGGECPYWGCVPSKMMIRAANLLAEGRRIPGLAGDSTVTPDWAPVARRIRNEATDNWDDRVAVERFEGKGGRFVRGEGRLAGPGRVQVADTTIEAARAIILATGTRAAVPPIPGLADVPYWTNRQAIEAKELPGSLIVIGGGAVGVELAQVFTRFGVEVTVVEALDRLLSLEEPEAGRLVADVLTREGATVRAGAQASGVTHDGRHFVLSLADGTDLSAERLLVATGRRADVASLGLASIGLDDAQRWVPVDERLRVAPGVWAVGDLTGAGAFTHVAMYQAGIPSARSSAKVLRRPTTGPCHASHSPTRRSAASGCPKWPPLNGASGSESARRRSLARPADGSTRPATKASSSSSRTPTVASSSEPPPPGRPAARSSACSPSPSTPGSPPATCNE